MAGDDSLNLFTRRTCIGLGRFSSAWRLWMRTRRRGGSALGKGRQPELKHGERYHMARRIVAVWTEPDPLTQAKCELLLGFNFGYRYGPDSLYHVAMRTRARLQENVKRLSPAQRQAFADFIQWCETAIEREDLGYRSRQYFEWLSDTFVTAAE